MLAITIELLTGRYAATTFNDRAAAEWPPHPARLFSALVAAWADTDAPDPDEREALEWLESQSPPVLWCSDQDQVVRRSEHIMYVPVNDAKALSTGTANAKADALAAANQRLAETTLTGDTKALVRAGKAVDKATAAYEAAVTKAASTGTTGAQAVLPENRNRQPRQFPTVLPADPIVCLGWPGATPDDTVRNALDRLLSRIGRLGHSSTLVTCRLDDPPSSAPTMVPDIGGDTVLRVPRSGLLQVLEREHGRHHGTGERHMPAAMAAYGQPGNSGETPRGLLAGDWYVLPLADDNRGSLHTVGLPRSLELATAVRQALAAVAENEQPTALGPLTGLWPDGQHRPHVAIVPLPDVGHRWAQGTVRGVALMLPRDAGTELTEPVEAALRAAAPLTVTLPGGATITFGAAVRSGHAGTGSGPWWDDVPHAVRRHTWCRRARQWSSATPIALDRFVPGLDTRHPSERALRTAQDLIMAACGYADLPEPAEIVISGNSPLTAVPRRFPPYHALGSGRLRQSVHATVRFDEEIAGPVLLGAGRYLGFGLLLPERMPEVAR